MVGVAAALIHAPVCRPHLSPALTPAPTSLPQERESLNKAIVESINVAAKNWGVEVLRYEIKDITPPSSVKSAMELQVRG